MAEGFQTFMMKCGHSEDNCDHFYHFSLEAPLNYLLYYHVLLCKI